MGIRGHGLAGTAPPARRAAWNLADQALSAATNVVMSLIVARSLPASGFGAYAAAFLVFSLLLGVERALIGLPLSIRHSALEADGHRRTASRAAGSSLSLAVTSALLLLTASFLVPDPLSSTLRALAAALPFLLVQDTCRMAFLAWSRPRGATGLDALWAAVQFTLVAVLLGTGTVSAASMVLAWGAGAAVSAGVGLTMLRAVPRPALRSWLAEHRAVSGYLLADYAVGIGALQAGVLVIGAWLGLADLGALRAAEILMGPLGVVALAFSAFAVPEISRRSAAGGELPSSTMRRAASISVLAVVASLAYAAVLLLVLPRVGAELLGDTWSGASTVIVPVALASAFASGKLGASVLTYGLGRVRSAFALSATMAVLGLTAMVVGAWQWGVTGVAWGLCTVQLVMIGAWFASLRHTLAEHRGITSPRESRPAAAS